MKNKVRSINPLKSAWVKKGTPLLERLFRIVGIVDNYTNEYRQVFRLSTRIRRIANILEPSKNKTSESVEKRLSRYLKEIEQTLTKGEDFLIVDNLKRYSKGFWKGLFTCYDHPILPRTNNDHKLFFRTIKRRHRRITGLRYWNRYIMRHGEYIVFAEDAINNPSILSRLASVSFDDYVTEIKKWETRTGEHIKRYQFKKNLD
ncbi:hypothetical protein NDK43_07600 [Neobacillus pocheonensis]|uniref:Transposase n=1 Tax=Neobacillus pocheonensis TaxID=363869 RepID=A0ABT0W7I6_9BACI|nr:hypothetical protein [Neobacillus pocheonensis]